MNVYMIRVASMEAQHAKKVIGYSSAYSEYKAVKAIGFTDLSLKDYGKDPELRDEWMYTASNAVNCLVYATKI